MLLWMSDSRDMAGLQREQGRDSACGDMNEDDAVRFLVGAIAGIASAVLAGRNLVSKKDVALRKMEGYDVKIMRKNTEAGIVFWNTMDGISDVIAKRYLREVIIVIAAGNHEEDETLEAYVITIYYPQEGERIVLRDLKGTEVAAITYKGGDAAYEDVVGLFRNVTQFIETLPPLPDYAIGHFRVSYYPNKPRNYTPQGFIPLKKVRNFSGSTDQVVLGAVNVRFFGCSLHVELPLAMTPSKVSSGNVQRKARLEDGKTVVRAASGREIEGRQGHVSTSTSNSTPLSAIHNGVVAGNRNVHNGKEKVTTTPAVPTKVPLTPSSGIGTMTVDTGGHGRARGPIPPVLAERAPEAARSAESGVEVGRADDEDDRSLQPEAADDILVREFNVGKEKLRRFVAKKRRQEEKERHLIEHEKREAIYRSLASEDNKQSAVSSDSVGAKTTLGSSSGTTSRTMDLSTNGSTLSKNHTFSDTLDEVDRGMREPPAKVSRINVDRFPVQGRRMMMTTPQA